MWVKNTRICSWIVVALLGLADSAWSASPQALQARDRGIPEELKGIGITENLGGFISVGELKFKNEQGEEVALSSFFASKKPVLLNLVYYECPSLCTFVLTGLLDSLKKLEWTPGNQFELVTLSINPKEGPELARKKKETYLKEYGRPEAAKGWHFLTGEESQIKKLASEVGFGYRYNERDQQYAHSAALFVLTPEGKISRYLYGIEYRPTDMRLALLEASDGRVGSVIDRILLLCYRYDPVTKKYSVYLTKVMQAGGAGTILIFGGYLTVFWRRQRKLSTEKSEA